MRKLSLSELKTCAMQGRFFQKTPSLLKCASPIAIRRFMNSNLAKRIDGSDLLSDTISPIQMADEIEQQYGPSAYGQTKWDSELLYWIGYVYRYWCIAEGITSKEAYRIASSREMAALYAPYHTLDPAQAISRILESKGISKDSSTHSDGYIEEGVEILRKIHEREHYEYAVMEF